MKDLKLTIDQESKQSKKLLELQEELKHLENVCSNIENYFLDNYDEEKIIHKKDINKIKEEINFIKSNRYKRKNKIMLKTNSKKYQENFKNYILSVIDGEDLPSKTMSDKEKIKFIIDRFTNEYDHEYNRRNTPNHQIRFGEWLRAGALNIPMYYGEILNLAKKLLESDTLKNEEWIKENYYSFMALQIIRLNEKLNK